MSHSDSKPNRVAVIGAGVMGLAAAYHLLKAGHKVDVYEADTVAGGMAAHFDFSGLSIERYYHFICKSDAPTFALLEELGIADTLRWKPTSMAYYTHNALHRWGDPLSLLRFPHLSLVEKFRYGLMAFCCIRRKNWRALDGMRADQWITKWIGTRAYQLLWERSFGLKFYEYANTISAAWIWSRIKRIGSSRRSLMQEELGYLEGGSETLVKALVHAIEQLGGVLHLGSKVKKIQLNDAGNAVSGIHVAGAFHTYTHVISTAPIPAVLPMLEDFPEALRARYAALPNIGVICVLHKLKRSVSPYFWVNVSDAEMDIPGLIEFSNLRPLEHGTHLVYVPYYMPTTNEKWQEDNASFAQRSFAHLQRINPEIKTDDVLDTHVARLRYAQPICPPNFVAMLPPIAPENIVGIQIADTSYYYPEDRGIAESVRLAKAMAERWNNEAPAKDEAAPKPKLHIEFMSFLLVGGVAATVNILMRFVLNFWLNYHASILLAHLSGMIVAFMLNLRFVFPSARSGKRLRQFVRFTLVNVATLAQIWLISVGLAEHLFPAINFHWHAHDVAHCIGVIAPAITSFLCHKWFSFR
jgi:protoporphyrinogen oxidase/putative flippase GtrA